jgi:hypothetical protein
MCNRVLDAGEVRADERECTELCMHEKQVRPMGNNFHGPLDERMCTSHKKYICSRMGELSRTVMVFFAMYESKTTNIELEVAINCNL